MTKASNKAVAIMKRQKTSFSDRIDKRGIYTATRADDLLVVPINQVLLRSRTKSLTVNKIMGPEYSRLAHKNCYLRIGSKYGDENFV
jgi:hypothetical protein